MNHYSNLLMAALCQLPATMAVRLGK